MNKTMAVMAILASAAIAADNLANVQNGFLLYCGDSVENYAMQAGSAYDGNSGTAWVSGADSKGHWMKCQWYQREVEIEAIEMDFTPFDYSYWTYAQLFRKETSRKVVGKTVRPSDLEVEVAFADGAGANYHIDLEGDVLKYTFERPLKAVSSMVVRMKGEGAVAVREMKVFGKAPAGSAAFLPQFSNLGGYWIWGDANPPNPSEKPTVWNFRREFDIGDAGIDRAVLSFAAYSKGTFFLNGVKLAETAMALNGYLPKVVRVDIGADKFRFGRNLIAVTGVKMDCAIGTQGVIYQLAIRMKDGRIVCIGSDAENTYSDESPEGWNSDLDACGGWRKANPFRGGGGYGKSLWGLDYSLPFFADKLRVTSVGLVPEQPKAGGEFALSVSFSAEKPLGQDYAVIAEFGELPVAFTTCESLGLGEAFLPPEKGLVKGFEGDCTLVMRGRWPRGTGACVPMRLTVCNGRAQAELAPAFDGASVPMAGKLACMLGSEVRLPKQDFPEAKVSGGRLWLDGRMVAPMCHTSSLLTADRFADFADHDGLRIFRVPAHGATHLMDGADGDSYCRDYLDVLKNAVMTGLRVNPQSKFLVMVSLDLPNDWLFEHESSQYERGDGGRQVALTGTRIYTFRRESVASEEVHEKVSRAMRRFVSELRGQPYANSIIGVVFAQGRAGENTWGLDINVDEKDGRTVVRDRDTMLIGDMSDACRRSFIKWLRSKYLSDSRWAEAWKQPLGRKIDDLMDRTLWPNERLLGELVWRNRPEGRFIFRDGKAEGTIAEDYFEFFNAQRALLFLAASRAVKEASDGRLIVGGYAGYTVPYATNSPPGLAQHCGHQMCSLLRESDCFDFISSPHIYDMRRMGDPVTPFGTVDSMRLNGKIVINEFDTRTFLSPISPKTFSQFESVHQMRKEFAYALIKGQGYWLLEFPDAVVGPGGASWYSDDALQRVLYVGRREYQRYLDGTVSELVKSPSGKSRELNKLGTGAEVALFLSEHVVFSMDVHAPANTVASNLINVLLPKFSLTGAPFDLYAFEDLQRLVDKGLHRQYKLMVFLNAFKVDGRTRKTIASRLKRDGRTLLFLYAPGLLGGDFSRDSSLSIKGIEELTEMSPVETIAHRSLIGMDLLENSIGSVHSVSHDAFGWSEELQREFYGDKIGPVFYLPKREGASWKTVATLRMDGKSESDKVAVAMKEDRRCRIVYSTVPDLPTELLSAIIAEAGVHRYAPEGVVVYANGSYLCVNNGSTARTIPLKAPRKARWIDVFTENCCCEGSDSMTVDMAAGETRLFRLEK